MGNSVRAAPSSPAPPGRPLALPPSPPGLLTPRRLEGPGSGPPGLGARVPGQRGEGLPSGRGGRRRAGPAGRVCPPGGGRVGRRAAEGVGGRPCPGPRGEAGRGSHSFLHSLLEAVSGRVKFGGLRRRLAAPAPPPPAPSRRPLPRLASGFHPRGSASAALPVAGSSPDSCWRPALSFHHLFLTFYLSLCPSWPLPLWSLVSPLYLALSLLNSLTRTLSPFINLVFFLNPTFILSFLIHPKPLFPSSLHLILCGFYSSLLPRLWILPFITCPPLFPVLI